MRPHSDLFLFFNNFLFLNIYSNPFFIVFFCKFEALCFEKYYMNKLLLTYSTSC